MWVTTVQSILTSDMYEGINASLSLLEKSHLSSWNRICLFFKWAHYTDGSHLTRVLLHSIAVRRLNTPAAFFPLQPPTDEFFLTVFKCMNFSFVLLNILSHYFQLQEYLILPL